jgi:hypothetical protein
MSRFVQRFAGSLPLLLVGCAATPPHAATSPPRSPDAWRTHAERTDFVETGRYAEAVDYCRRLAAAAPEAHYTTFGKTGAGRDLPLLILSRDRAFTPAAAQRTRKPVILIQNCIHAGECEGKDACLMLAREILITRARAALLDHATLLILPIFNADGHERMSPYSRINQNGPREMGWRTNATNLNLNRDFAKADAPETQAWLRLWNAWQPDLFIDCHTTDGEEQRYDLFYTFTDDEDVAPPIAAWLREQLYPAVIPPLAAEGYALLPYGWLRNRKDPAEGIMPMAPTGPRFVTGYVAACNRPAILIEAHARNPYGHRVRATHAFLVRLLEAVNQQVDALRAAVQQADALTVRMRGGDRDGRVPIEYKFTTHAQRVTYHGYEQTLRKSEVTGDDVIDYSTTPRDYETSFYDEPSATRFLTPPLAYLVPPQWTDVIDRLALHGIRFTRLTAPQTLDVDSYRFAYDTLRVQLHEGRAQPAFTPVSIRETRAFAAGTVFVPLDQPRAKLAVHLLEPAAPDSFAAWGFFNAVFEQKEYAEPYVIEPLARQLLAADPQLRADFAARLAADPEFAKSPGARLNYFYVRSPYADALHNVYPVARVTSPDTLARIK